MYVRAFQKMIDNHPGQIRILDPNAKTKFKLELAENSIGGGYDKSVLQDSHGSSGLVPPRMEQDESLSGSSQTAIPDNTKSGGTMDAMVGQKRQQTVTSSDEPCSNDGKRLLSAEAIMNDWETHDGILSPLIRTRTAGRDFKPAPQLADEGQVVFAKWLEMGAI